MNESFPNKSPEKSKEEIKAEYIALAEKLSQNHEGFSFSGIESEYYTQLKADDEECPGMSTPVDEIIERMKNEGFKVVFGKDPASGNVFILPLNSNDIDNDMLFPRHLMIDDSMSPELKKLILINKKGFSK